jgi:FAD/FMN-containing dehydrogenase
MAGEQPGAYSDLLRDIKKMLDPAGILAPGRYVNTGSEVLDAVNAGVAE